MPGSELSLLAIDRGLVVAAAGCGKTQLIANALRDHKFQKPILVLTHTNSGVKNEAPPSIDRSWGGVGHFTVMDRSTVRRELRAQPKLAIGRSMTPSHLLFNYFNKRYSW
jgi:hypothetical protein